jgi:hypothetical protein
MAVVTVLSVSESVTVQAISTFEATNKKAQAIVNQFLDFSSEEQT